MLEQRDIFNSRTQPLLMSRTDDIVMVNLQTESDQHVVFF